MTTNKYCSCCDSVSVFYYNGKSGKFAQYCINCNTIYTFKERQNKELKNILKLINTTEINEKCNRL